LEIPILLLSLQSKQNKIAMKNVEAAIKALEALGVPVRDDQRHGGLFWLDAESEKAHGWLDYHQETAVSRTWGDWTINDKIHVILDEHGLFAEWENSAIVNIYAQ